MKKIGIIGGIGWPSTVEYYRLICEASQLHYSSKNFSGPTPMPEMVIESLNMNFTVNNRGTFGPGSWAAWDAYFNQAMKRLEAGGAELIVIASVTPHARLNEISKGIGVPVISIYDAIGTYCAQSGIHSLLVLGTMPTMTSPAFQLNLKSFGVSAQYPPNEELKSEVVDIIGRLYQNHVDGASDAIGRVVRTAVAEGHLDGTAVCLGCTELPLACPEHAGSASFTVNGIRFVNASVIHTEYAFKACVDGLGD